MAEAANIRVGILETGFPPQALNPGFDSYGGMIRALLGADYTYQSFDVTRGTFPAAPEDFDAYLITGSSAGVYDDLPWIPPLTGFLRAAKGRAKLVGICFGHQIMAQAFGGQVVKSPKGWGLGLHTYAIAEPAPWMDGASTVAVAVSHQDQVVALPPGARAVAGNDFTPNGILAYDDGVSISFQCHPEFTASFAAALVEARRPFLPEGMADAMAASLDSPSDRDRVGAWIRSFLDEK